MLDRHQLILEVSDFVLSYEDIATDILVFEARVVLHDLSFINNFFIVDLVIVAIENDWQFYRSWLNRFRRVLILVLRFLLIQELSVKADLAVLSAPHFEEVVVQWIILV